jgi:predicted alpha/beta superfamily hydrolase
MPRTGPRPSTTIAGLTIRLAGLLTAETAATVHFEPMHAESHGTIYHPAALRAFRTLFPVPDAE